MHQLTLDCQKVLWVCALAAATTACSSGGGGHASQAGPAAPVVDSGSSEDDSSGATGPQDTGTGTPVADGHAGSGNHPPPSQDATPGGNAGDDGAALDAGAAPDSPVALHDGGLFGDGASAEGGIRDVGSCCSAQATPGCSNPNLELCVCQKLPDCCTVAWSLACTLIVQQKYCQPNVRDCVCGSDAGEWGQNTCCMNDWTSTCDSVATLKCNAVQGCF